MTNHFALGDLKQETIPLHLVKPVPDSEAVELQLDNVWPAWKNEIERDDIPAKTVNAKFYIICNDEGKDRRVVSIPANQVETLNLIPYKKDKGNGEKKEKDEGEEKVNDDGEEKEKDDDEEKEKDEGEEFRFGVCTRAQVTKKTTGSILKKKYAYDLYKVDKTPNHRDYGINLRLEVEGKKKKVVLVERIDGKWVERILEPVDTYYPDSHTHHSEEERHNRYTKFFSTLGIEFGKGIAQQAGEEATEAIVDEMKAALN